MDIIGKLEQIGKTTLTPWSCEKYLQYQSYLQKYVYLHFFEMSSVLHIRTERDATSWSKSKLKELFKEVKVENDEGNHF